MGAAAGKLLQDGAFCNFGVDMQPESEIRENLSAEGNLIVRDMWPSSLEPPCIKRCPSSSKGVYGISRRLLQDVKRENSFKEAVNQTISHPKPCLRELGEKRGYRLPGTSGQSSNQSGADLTTIMTCHKGLFLEIVHMVADSPQIFVNFCGLASRTANSESDFPVSPIWEEIYKLEFPAFYDCFKYHGAQVWKNLYRDTLSGRSECTLEVFDREKKLGFAMAAMPAVVTYEAGFKVFWARYLSASEVLPERIPKREAHRFRFCPPSARACLQPGCGPAEVGFEFGAMAKFNAKANMYPYRVLHGTERLQVGKGVELQWKMQVGSPFGWWYGKLESLKHEPDGTRATATITFEHFPSHSRWYRLEVRFGDGNMRPCSFGGYTGGIRGATAQEHLHWMRFFPKEPVVF